MWSESRLALGDGVGDAFQMLISQKPGGHVWAACRELQQQLTFSYGPRRTTCVKLAFTLCHMVAKGGSVCKRFRAYVCLGAGAVLRTKCMVSSSFLPLRQTLTV